MWSDGNKIWTQYSKSILACDVDSAMLLSQYIGYLRSSRSYIRNLEILDLQKYKVHTSPKKVRQMLNERTLTPFVFTHCNN